VLGEYQVEVVSPAGALLVLAVPAVTRRGPECVPLPLLPGLLAALYPSAMLGLESATVLCFSATVATCVLLLTVAYRLHAPLLAAAMLLGLGIFIEHRHPKMSDLRTFVESRR
jgi:hypothetical protein